MIVGNARNDVKNEKLTGNNENPEGNPCYFPNSIPKLIIVIIENIDIAKIAIKLTSFNLEMLSANINGNISTAITISTNQSEVYQNY